MSQTSTRQYGNYHATPIVDGKVLGFDKHFGRAVCAITLNRDLWSWRRITINTGVDLKENTDPCSAIKQYQVIREEGLTLEIECEIPVTGDGADDFAMDFRQGVVIDRFSCNLIEDMMNSKPNGAPNSDPNRYGTFMITDSNIDFSRDEFTSMRLTVRSMGYGNAMAIGMDTGVNPNGYTNYSETGMDSDFPS